MTFGEKLQGLRQKAELSQDGLAEQLGVSRQPTLSHRILLDFWRVGRRLAGARQGRQGKKAV